MPETLLAPTLADRQAIVDWFLRTRRRSAALFDLLQPDAYYAQPIALRHPIVFYEGHLAAFSLNTLVKKALGRPGIDGRLERLFARGIDPDDEQSARGAGLSAWPARDEVRAFVQAADALVLDALECADLDRDDVPLLQGGQAVYAIIEHEQMHQETMLYMWHRLPYEMKRKAGGPGLPAETREPHAAGRAAADRPGDAQTTRSPARANSAGVPAMVTVPAGLARLGARRREIAFGWDNEFEALHIHVPSFAIDRLNVTNAGFMEFVDAGGYHDDRWWTPAAWKWLREENVTHPLFWEERGTGWVWRGMFEDCPLAADWPVYVSQAEAAAFARWRGKRLPTEAEFDRAAYGSPAGDERAFPWGNASPDPSRATIDFTTWNPVPVGSHPAGQSAWGIEDLVGNGWEWTSTVFAPFPGFSPLPSYPEYSADFFDGQHYVMKGGSIATARELVRRSFRNWFRPHYPYVYATFRCVTDM